MNLTGRIVSAPWFSKLRRTVLPREIAIIEAHREAFAPGSSQVTATRIFRHLAAVARETVFRLRPEVIIEPATRALIDQLRPLPVLALTGHLGNWEYLARFGTKDGFRLAVIARPARIKIVQRILEAVRGDLNVIWRSGPTLKAAAEVLKGGAWLGALIDQDLEARGVRVPGFGLRAHTPSSLVELAIKSQARVISAFMMRESPGRYRLIVEQLDTAGGVAAVLEGFQRNMHAVVSRYPDQWVWFHKRWRTTQRERISGCSYIPYIESLLPLGDPFVIVHTPRLAAPEGSGGAVTPGEHRQGDR